MKGPLGDDPLNKKEKIEDTASWKALNGSKIGEKVKGGETNFFDKIMNKFDIEKPKDENDV